MAVVIKTGAFTKTNFAFPEQTGVYHGKVRDVYTIKDKYLVSVATNRISAFDVILPCGIPHKGQILNQLAKYFMDATKNIVPNWLISVPDPNVSIGIKCEPIRIEVVVRNALVGHVWREYDSGKREICGEPMPNGLKQYDKFKPIITPATKAAKGHDEDISASEIIKSNIVSKKQWDEISDLALKIFAKGQQMAEERNLFLADTKYEFGILEGQIYLIDEIHTPDSSRYFYKDSYEKYLKDRKDEPMHLSKEFVREWLMSNGFSGQAGQRMPEMTDEFVNAVSQRYIKLYEEMTGKKFEPIEDDNALTRIEKNVLKALGDIK